MPGFPQPRPDALAPVPLGSLAALTDRRQARLSPADAAAVTVTGITHDSTAVRPGDLYAALRGSRTHGARFAQQAAAAGAVAILTDPDGEKLAAVAGVPLLVVDDPRAVLGPVARAVYGDPTDGMLLLGVTGTNGKTTSAYLLEAGLRAAGHRTGLIGTVETRIGDDALPSVRTTPEATDLQALFAVMRERGVSAAAMEVSSHALALRRVDGLRFDVAAFTNLSQDHLDFHKDLDDYFAAKARLFTPPFTGTGVVNVDDAYGRRLAGLASDIRVVTIAPSGAAGADWRALGTRPIGRAGTAFTAIGPQGVQVAVRTRLVGEFNVANALLALAVLVTAGVAPDSAAAGIGAVDGVPGRMERIDAGQRFLALVDFAHTPQAVRELLRAVRQLSDGRVIVVLGCGGDRDRAKRPMMGALAARLADVAVFTSDNPRGEDPRAILAEVVAGATDGPASASIVVEPDRAVAIAEAVSRAAAGDVLVVAGKGHEQGQEVAGEVRPFDDRAVLRAAIERALG